MKSLLLSIFCSLIYYNSNAQFPNLVPNPSFEELDGLPPTNFSSKASNFDNTMQDWNAANLTSPDILTKSINNKTRSYQIHEARTGETMVGILNNLGIWVEYIQVPLKQSLEEGKTYYAEFWYIALASKNHEAPQKNPNFGLWFHDGSLQQTKNYIAEQPQVAASKIEPCTPYTWHKMSGTFVASKAHSHVCIGQFESSFDGAMNGCVAIDDVLVRETKHVLKIVAGTTLVLNNIIFRSGTATLEKESYASLQSLYQALSDNPKLCIAIHGYTDNVGNSEDNLSLSISRAQTIYNYLIQESIDKKRLQFRGFGENQPVATNKTSLGRKKNRRVEFLVRGTSF
ncbi:MAG: OmpA family protein [Aureispira sp.]|nr:OmpA family protein [Aureispira sp.]